MRPIAHKVSIGEEGQAYTQYEMEMMQRIEQKEMNKKVIRITGGASNDGGESRFDAKYCKLRFGVKELFQMLMLNC